MNSGKLPESFRIVDRTGECDTGPVSYAFAVDELLCRRVGEGAVPLVHLWRHERAFVTGLRDRRLPSALRAMEWLEHQGYAVTVRSSGGAAVPLDAGVVNISLILPKDPGDMDFQRQFELMYRLIRETLEPFGVKTDKGEVAGSYCPGDYDLSAEGRKFCGLAQRRQTRAFVVQAFVVVEGSGGNRAALVRDFYRQAAPAAGEGACSGEVSYPRVRPETMVSLQEYAGITVSDFTGAFQQMLAGRGGIPASPEEIFPSRDEILRTMDDLRKGYEKRN